MKKRWLYNFVVLGLLAFFLLIGSADTLQGLDEFFWEHPTGFSPGTGRFPVSSGNGTLSVVAWQESDGSAIRLCLGVKKTGTPWQVQRDIGGPYSFTGTEPSILSALVDSHDRIILAVAASSTETELLISRDQGQSFIRRHLESKGASSLAPRIYERADGGYLLFITRGGEEALSLYYSRSDDGMEWNDFKIFVTEAALRLNFLPTHEAGWGKDFVVFQSLTGDLRPTFQLYITSSVDGGITWTAPRRLTDMIDAGASSEAQRLSHDNQRPHLSVQGDRLFLVWERRQGSGYPQVFSAELGKDGFLQGNVEQLSQTGGYANNPMAFSLEGEPALIWFDNRRGQNRIYMARRQGFVWQESDLSGTAGEASFGRVIQDGDGLYVFWQLTEGNRDRIYLLEPDRTVAAPKLRGIDFESRVRTRRDTATITWQAPEDPSGVAGYSYSWSMDPRVLPPQRLMVYSASTRGSFEATEDGLWYFSLRAQDYAGNWSEAARIEFLRDTTPPPMANVVLPSRDDDGFLLSNTFSLRWNQVPASDLAGYTWNLEYLGPAEQGMEETRFKAPTVPPRLMGNQSSVTYENLDDGLWRFSLSAVDTVGNIGKEASVYFLTNKYISYTSVRYADTSRDERGVLRLRILGRGFTDEGSVSNVFLDRDGKEPYDRTYHLERDDYVLASDREIRSLAIEDMEEGRYRIGLLHPERGLYFTAPLVWIDETGTVKYGAYSKAWEPSWSLKPTRRFIVDPLILALIGIFFFCALGFTVSLRGITDVVAESASIRLEAMALISGDLMPSEKKRRLRAVRRRGGGLRVKLASFTSLLVIVVVILVSAPLSVMMTRTQEATLLQGLRDRSRVLLESLASGARAYLPSRNVLELGFLPSQTEAVPEARYTTITGFGSASTVFNDHIWATNDPDIDMKIDSSEFQVGLSRLQDVLSPRLEQIAKELDVRAREEVAELSESISALTQEGLALALKTDSESVRRRDDIQETTRTLESRLTERLSAIASEIGSEPAFPMDTLPQDGTELYIFFKPVMYRQGSENMYFRGLVRLEVSIASIVEQVAAGRMELIQVTGLIALIAIAIGIGGALLFSALIIRPIQKLVSHVEMIRDTEDKALLEGKDILIPTKDEIAILGMTINDMTHGLVKAAQASRDLTIGKEVQKKFIPLETDRMGNKLTHGHTEAPFAEFYGYYEGAKGVSGDYYDYMDLDGRYYAIIKCDVAGKGIPAALIMIQVATMFRSHFKNWKPTPEGLRIERVVYQINDFIEALGFKGRFAAFTLCLLDAKTGLVRFCNAGDNIVHWYDASEKTLKTTVLPETPATGVLPNDLIDMKGGYSVQSLHLDTDDILMLYTDGIEEAKRKFRDTLFKEIVCSHDGGEVDTPHGNHMVGQGDEEMGYDRVQAIFEAVMEKSGYILTKYHNPEGDKPLEFNFHSCKGTVEEAIMALVSVEKIFRMYKRVEQKQDARVLVDRKVDEFLNAHFIQYRDYCLNKKDHPEQQDYIYYTYVEEDEQYDDLTILGIRKK